jgi:hypothetical protein
MVKVELPRADWESVIIVMKYYHEMYGGYIKPIIKEIEDQVYSQEY